MQIYLVGGAVRDKLLHLPVKEKDWVVVGAVPEDLLRLGYKQVGKEFPVFLHPQTAEEYALARLERKVAPGYTGFVFDTSPQVTLEEDLRRRDLTINAMAETLSGELIDPCRGREDLENKILRHVSPAFAEDPVRILRLARFAARYAKLGFQVAPETLALMKAMVASGEVSALVPERVWKEFERALGEASPEVFFQVLADCEALPVVFPGIQRASPGMVALTRAAQATADTRVRFAALMHAASPEELNALCKRFRLPQEYCALARLVLQFNRLAWKAAQLSASEFLGLFSVVDAFRREERFLSFLAASAACATGPFPRPRLLAAYQAAKQASVTDWLTPGMTGPEIAEKLKQERLSRLEHWLLNNP